MLTFSDSSRSRSEQSLVRWATPQLHDIDALAKMVDPALKGLYPVKSLSRFADVIALCVQVRCLVKVKSADGFIILFQLLMVKICSLILIFYRFGQPEPEFRPPMSEVVQALVRLVQRANMSKRTISNEQGASPRGDNPDTQYHTS